MKKLFVLMAFAAITISASAQHTYYGSTAGSAGYVDRATLNKRAENYKHLINDKSRDVKLEYDTKSKQWIWYSMVGTKSFLGLYDESITMSEKKILDKKKSKKVKTPIYKEEESPNAFSSGDIFNVK